MNGITLPIELEDADVLVSSGYNTKLLRRVTDKPIINIEPSLYDILSAYSEAITYENSHPVIIFPIKQYTNLTERIKNILMPFPLLLMPMTTSPISRG